MYPFSNEANEYIPKRKRNKIYQMLNRKGHMCTKIIEKTIDLILIKLTSKHTCKNMRKSRYTKRSNTYRYAYTVVALEAKANKRMNTARFDTDLAPVGIDYRCTGCISHVAEDFLGPLHDSGKAIKGFAKQIIRLIREIQSPHIGI